LARARASFSDGKDDAAPLSRLGPLAGCVGGKLPRCPRTSSEALKIRKSQEWAQANVVDYY